jgi:NAD(P)-dependent dehydrogenase (short-subunit alcohol dehydrogenase family)
MHKVLVIGRRDGNLGDEVYKRLNARNEAEEYEIEWADIKGGGRNLMDLTSPTQVKRSLNWIMPDTIFYCAGVNVSDEQGLAYAADIQMQVNYMGFVLITDHFQQEGAPNGIPRAIAVSSNSAHIARSRSAGYCASKAALSMFVRAEGRRAARDRDGMMWGYEPGWLENTPMSRRIERDLGDLPKHRIPSGASISPVWLASRMVGDWEASLRFPDGFPLDGTMTRYDGGEQ